MNLATVLQHLAGAQARVSVESGHLRLRGPRKALTDDLKREVFEHKAELLALLTAPDREVRDRLRVLAAERDSGINPNVIERMLPAELAECRTMPDEALRVRLLVLTDTHDRMMGRAPAGWTAAALCDHCGPVWLHPAVVLALSPVGDGLRHAKACPWCPEHADGRLFARPKVMCRACARFVANENNPEAGLGRCNQLNNGQWPLPPRECGFYRPQQDTP